jgi:zinc protease
LYRALVERGLASAVSGALIPTEQPFVYFISATATDGTPLAAVEEALAAELETVASTGITEAELTKARAQLNARLVFDNDSITNIAHQLGYFETIGGVDVFRELRTRVAAVTLADVAGAARATLDASNRTVGWFDPLPVESR